MIDTDLIKRIEYLTHATEVLDRDLRMVKRRVEKERTTYHNREAAQHLYQACVNVEAASRHAITAIEALKHIEKVDTDGV
jgi:hypothetical protein